MKASVELLFLGLPDAGKTTYLLALDEILETEQHGLVSSGFGANRDYLEKAKEMWRAGDPISRSNLKPINESIELLVRHSETAEEVRLLAPDVYGEFYDAQWADRQIPTQYRDRLHTLSGVLVFVNAARTGGIPEMTQLWKKSSATKTPGKKWNPRFSPEQLKLIDLLQVIVEYGNPKVPVPIAVMISAWDLLESRTTPKLLPEDYLHKDWSLLKQYLDSNSDMFRSHIYGVSARGGKKEDKAELIKVSPQERVWLKDGKEVTSDLTLPIRWLLDWS